MRRGIFSDAAEGLCTACLLETGLGLFSEAVPAVGDARRIDRNIAPERMGGF